MKKTILIITLLICGFNNAQEQDQRILKIKNQLEFLATEVNGLTENVKTEINVANITLSNFLLAISEVHKVNINISPQLLIILQMYLSQIYLFSYVKNTT